MELFLLRIMDISKIIRKKRGAVKSCFKQRVFTAHLVYNFAYFR